MTLTLAQILVRHDVAATTDEGHDGLKNGYSAWAAGHPQKILDWGNRAQLETVQGAKVLIRRYYGKPVRYAYLAGCSGGGWTALKEAQQHPAAWDGIIAGDPTMGGSRFLAYAAQHAQLWRSNPAGWIPPEKLPLIHRTALAACTAQAQLIQGIAGDPRFCRFDPSVLLCKGQDPEHCLTPPQVETLRALYDGPRSPRTGLQIYPGLTPTADLSPVTGQSATDENGAPFHLFLIRSFYRDFLDLGSQWDVDHFDMDTDVALFEHKPLGQSTLGKAFAADDPNLFPFKRRGGRLILYYGWVDPIDSPQYAIQYYKEAARRLGGIDAVRRFFRLLLVPGMEHCGGGEGANIFGQPGMGYLADDPAHNVMRALESWVEEGRRPDNLIAAKFVDGEKMKGVSFTRPLCSYPQVLKYRGSGSADLAENFMCAAPVR